jgi:uncharacterized membrane protein
MGLLKDIFSKETGNIVATVGEAIDKITTSKEERMQIDLEMKKAEMQYLVDLKKLTLEEQKIVTAEMDSARRREVDVASSQYSTRLSKNIAPYLAIGTTILTFGLFLFILIREVDEGKKEIIFYILGVLSAVVTQIFAYYFGSSMGSFEKAQTIDKIVRKDTMSN